MANLILLILAVAFGAIATNEFFLPTETWQQIANHCELSDFIHLSSTKKALRIALAKQELIEKLAGKMHNFSFPIYEDNKNPYRTLRCIHYFNRANKDFFVRSSSQPNAQLGKIEFKGISSDCYFHRDDGTIYAEGSNVCGKLGLGEEGVFFKTPTQIQGALKDKKIITLETGYFSTIALSSEGKVYIWGEIPYFDTVAHHRHMHTPFLVEAELANKRVIAIRAGFWHFLALTDDGELYGFGSLGLKQHSLQKYKSVTLIKGPWKSLRVLSMQAGYQNTLVLTIKGKIYSWGDNRRYELGLGSKKRNSINRPLPIKNKLKKKFVAITMGSQHVLTLTDEGQIFVWGHGVDRLGLGPLEDLITPTLVEGPFKGKKAIAILAEGRFGTAITEDGQRYFW